MVWDDGDDTLAEPRAPYPHAREVAMLRAHQMRCAALIGGYARTAEAHALVRSGWAHDMVAARPVVRARAPAGGRARRRRLRRGPRPGGPHRAAAVGRAARRPLGAGGRGAGAGAGAAAGICASLACARCRTIARCRHCTGPLSLSARDGSGCRSAGGAAAPTPPCGAARCGSDAVRAVVVGARRTAEELGRAFPVRR